MFLWAFFILCFMKSSCGCGISTHTEIGYRAIEYLGFSEEASSQFIRNIMQSHQDAFQAGNPFPDSFYNSLCYGGMYHQKSEDTHWGHYVKVAFDFINRKLQDGVEPHMPLFCDSTLENQFGSSVRNQS